MSNTERLFPKIRLVIGTMDGCPWCTKLKTETMPMIKAMGIRYQIITDDDHLDAYNAFDYGLPYIGICDEKGYPLEQHGGFVTISELLEMVNDAHDKHFPNVDKNTQNILVE